MTYLMKFKSEANMHKVYTAFKGIKLNLRVDPANLLLQVSDVKWTLPEIRSLVKEVGGCNVKIAQAPA